MPSTEGVLLSAKCFEGELIRKNFLKWIKLKKKLSITVCDYE